MPWIKELCVNAICGGALGIRKGIFGIDLLTNKEVQEIESLRKLTHSVLTKSLEFSTDFRIYDAIKQGSLASL